MTVAFTAKSIEESFVRTEHGNRKFVLDSYGFKALQSYLAAALDIPSTAAVFESRFDKESFVQFFPDDQPLYDAIKLTLIAIHTHSSDFRSKSVPALTTLGGNIASFADNGKERFNKLKDDLTLITANGSSLNDSDVKRAVRHVEHDLDALTKHAEEIRVECQTLNGMLATFQTDTVSDRNSLDDSHKRFAKIIPDGKAVVEVGDDLVKDLRKKSEDAKSTWERAKKTAEGSVVHWYFWLAGPKSFEKATILHPQDVKEAERYHDSYDKALKAVGVKADTILRSQVHLQGLSHALESVENTIADALESLAQIMRFTTEMNTNFSDIKRHLGNMKDDVRQENVDDREEYTWEEFKKAPKIWDEVATLARDFQKGSSNIATQKKSPTVS